ncbi:hypothetical protein GOP47_0004839 [Adiantum capillus-veneris]|uniref:Uncharacterized protein n=1 Tax=Adiantum capillus-veneris TaxID=13818 RepID=A0A9D4ZNK8_ADICA|nr:hypothetical protein GOP47_0004839 [Adiantum capillus-veneris]
MIVVALPTPTPSVLQTLAPFLPLPNPGRQTKPEYHRELMNTHSKSNHCNAKHNWWCEDMSSRSMYMMERVVMALQSHCIDNKHISKVLLRVSITMVASCSCRQQIEQMIGLAKLQGESGHNGNLDPVEELELKHGYGGAIKSAPIRVVGTHMMGSTRLWRYTFRYCNAVFLRVTLLVVISIPTQDAIQVCRAVHFDKLSFESWKHVMENPQIPAWISFRVLALQ